MYVCLGCSYDVAVMASNKILLYSADESEKKEKVLSLANEGVTSKESKPNFTERFLARQSHTRASYGQR